MLCLDLFIDIYFNLFINLFFLKKIFPFNIKMFLQSYIIYFNLKLKQASVWLVFSWLSFSIVFVFALVFF